MTKEGQPEGTPQTDAAVLKFESPKFGIYSVATGGPTQLVTANFARALERQLAEANASIDKWREQFRLKAEQYGEADERAETAEAALRGAELYERRYKIARNFIPPKYLSTALGIPWVDIPEDQEIEEKIDELCDAAIAGEGKHD